MNDLEENRVLETTRAILTILDYPLPVHWRRLRTSLVWTGKENEKFTYAYEIEPIFFIPNEWILTIYIMNGKENVHIPFDTELSAEENVDLYLMRKL